MVPVEAAKPDQQVAGLAETQDPTSWATNDNVEMNNLKNDLSKSFKMKDMGPVRYCLEFKQRHDGWIAMSQKKYTAEVIAKIKMETCKTSVTPLNGNEGLQKPIDAEDETGNFPYQSLVGSLMYLAVCTRPDSAYAVSSLSQYNERQGKAHWNAAKRVVLERYA